MISLILPIHNSTKHLKRVLQSVLAQTYDDFELIVIDDYSQDDPLTIIEPFEDRRIKYYRNVKNYGPFGSYCQGLRYAKREFIALIDHDDILHEEKLKKQKDRMTDFNLNICATNYYVTDCNGKVIYKTNIKTLVNDELIYKPFVFHNPTVMIKKKIIEKYGFFNGMKKFGADYEYYLSLSLHESMAVMPDHLSYWQFSINSFSHKHIKEVHISSKDISLFFLNKHNDKFSERSVSYYKILIEYYANNILSANKNLLKHIIYNPTDLKVFPIFFKITLGGILIKFLRKMNIVYQTKKICNYFSVKI